jgi:hypothetical protein
MLIPLLECTPGGVQRVERGFRGCCWPSQSHTTQRQNTFGPCPLGPRSVCASLSNLDFLLLSRSPSQVSCAPRVFGVQGFCPFPWHARQVACVHYSPHRTYVQAYGWFAKPQNDSSSSSSSHTKVVPQGSVSSALLGPSVSCPLFLFRSTVVLDGYYKLPVLT